MKFMKMQEYELTLVAKRRELRVSEKQSSLGLMFRNIKVLLLPPKQFCNKCVNLLFR